MAKKKAPTLSPEAIAANAAGEAMREKEKQDRQKNAEKQKRFRESMKAEGYRRVTLWDMPSPADKRMAGMGYRKVPAWELLRGKTEKSRAVKVTLAVRIRESSLHAGARLPQVQEAVKKAGREFLKAVGEGPEGKAVYNDFIELAALLCDPYGED
jgi:ABC-type oligopeptide transport system substrate-binding subunit